MRLRIFLTIFAVMAIFATANSQIVFTENFDYTAGDSIGAHGWVPNTGSTNNIMVVSPGLTYTGYPLSNIGNACRLRNNGIDGYKPFSGDSVSSASPRPRQGSRRNFAETFHTLRHENLFVNLL